MSQSFQSFVAAGEGEDGMVNGLNGDIGMEEGDLDKPVRPVAPEKPAPSTRKIRVTYEEYKSISNLLILHLRQIEETSPGEGIAKNIKGFNACIIILAVLQFQ